MDYCTSYQYRNTSHIYNKHWSSTWTRIWGLKSATTGIYIFFSILLFMQLLEIRFSFPGFLWLSYTYIFIYFWLFIFITPATRATPNVSTVQRARFEWAADLELSTVAAPPSLRRAAATATAAAGGGFVIAMWIFSLYIFLATRFEPNFCCLLWK